MNMTLIRSKEIVSVMYLPYHRVEVIFQTAYQILQILEMCLIRNHYQTIMLIHKEDLSLKPCLHIIREKKPRYRS